jgi:hypothetical protein
MIEEEQMNFAYETERDEWDNLARNFLKGLNAIGYCITPEQLSDFYAAEFPVI